MYSQYQREIDYFNVLTNKFETDLFFNSRHLLSLRANKTSLSGSIRDMKDSLHARNGLFLNTQIDKLNAFSKNRLTMYSESLSFLFGDGYELNMENSIDIGHYIDFGHSELNGFFIRADTFIKLFNIFKVKVNFEVEQVTVHELRRRFELLDVNKNLNCTDCQISNVAAYLFFNINYNPELLQTPLDSLASTYFTGYIKTKSTLRFPLLPNYLSINSDLRGFFIMPNPFKTNNSLHLEFVTRGKYLNSKDVEIKWTMDEYQTQWAFDGAQMGLLDVDVTLQAKSLWSSFTRNKMRGLEINSLFKMPKKFKTINIHTDRFIKKYVYF